MNHNGNANANLHQGDGEEAKPAAKLHHAAVVPDGAASSMSVSQTNNSTINNDNHQQERRRKRRRLRNHMRSQGPHPLFSQYLATDFDVPTNDNVIVIHDSDSDDDDMDPIEVIDVDVHLGLKADPDAAPSTAVAPSPSRMYTRGAKQNHRGTTVAEDINDHLNIHTEKQSNNSTAPLEEGWYEGVVSPMAMPEDAFHLNTIHCFVRQQLELFSADRFSRRKRGRVGLRCKFCAATKTGSAWPNSAMSFPNTFSSVHQACAQRFQVHWLTQCPHIPEDLRTNLQIIVNQGGQGQRSRGALSAPTYYALSLQRIGLVETTDGLRFGRDLSLEPLPLETVRATMDAKMVHVDKYHGSMEDPISAASSALGLSADVAMKEARASIGEEAERVLAECIAEADQPEKYVTRSSDKGLVTDYMFITIRQMALCHAQAADMGSRGKKTKLMQPGFTGFCCRFCQDAAGGGSLVYVAGSCRSFLSAPDNLGSAISNSFTQHLQKCRNVPPSFQKAMVALKRIHHRQMSLLPYGSQRKFFHLTWDRLRAADMDEEELKRLLPKAPPPIMAVAPIVEAKSKVKKQEAHDKTTGVDNVIENAPAMRPENFPESEDPGTRQILEWAELSFAAKKVPAAEYILLPEERNLISDFVFLTLMQLSPITSTSADQGRSRRGPIGNVMGVACIHCADNDYLVTPSGRSFPSAPDNFASAFNTSLYNHMQACVFIPEEIKIALANLRRLHSKQCSSLAFGSQRRYFKLLFNRLQTIRQGLNPESLPTTLGSKDTLRSLGFMKLDNGSGQTVYTCKDCRMVPSAFRARDAFCMDRLSLNKARGHRAICQKDRLDLSLAIAAFKALADSLERDPNDLIQNKALGDLVAAVVGRDENLTRVLLDGTQSSLRNTNGTNNDYTSLSSGGLWKHFPETVSFSEVNEAFKRLASDIGIESNLADLPLLCDFLMTISPTLSIPEPSEKQSEPDSALSQLNDAVKRNDIPPCVEDAPQKQSPPPPGSNPVSSI